MGGSRLSIRLKIEQFNNKLSKTEEKIADYILKNISEIKDITSGELAKRSGVGQSSIIKFIKKIGFNGFTEFKIRISEELASKKISKPDFLHNNITADDSASEVIKKISYSHVESIEATTSNISYDTLDQIVEILDNANKIIILGIGASSLVGKDFQHKLSKIGKMAFHDFDTHVQATQAINTGVGDAVITISHSGETSIFIETLNAIKDNGSKTISITGSDNNSIAKSSHLNLCAIATEDLIRSSALSSRIAQLTIIDSLFITLLKRNHSNALEYIESSKNIIKTLNNHN